MRFFSLSRHIVPPKERFGVREGFVVAGKDEGKSRGASRGLAVQTVYLIRQAGAPLINPSPRSYHTPGGANVRAWVDGWQLEESVDLSQSELRVVEKFWESPPTKHGGGLLNARQLHLLAVIARMPRALTRATGDRGPKKVGSSSILGLQGRKGAQVLGLVCVEGPTNQIGILVHRGYSMEMRAAFLAKRARRSFAEWIITHDKIGNFVGEGNGE